MTAPPAQSVIMHQPRTILPVTAPKRIAPKIHLGGFAGAVVTKGLASTSETRVAAHVRRTRRTSAQQQRAGNHHDFDEVGDHFSVPCGMEARRSSLEEDRKPQKRREL